MLILVYIPYPYLMQQESYYDLLGLRPDATTKQIEAACQQMLRLYQSSGANPHRLAELKDAHAVLTDPTKRAAYNGSLKPGKTGHADSTRGAVPVEPGKGLRWLVLLVILASPLLVTAWWVNRPVRVPQTPTAAAEEKPAPLSADAVELVHAKNNERERLVERQNAINQQFVYFAEGKRKLDEGEGYSYAESDKREAAQLTLERDWINERLAAIDGNEMALARRGIATPALFYKAPDSQ